MSSLEQFGLAHLEIMTPASNAIFFDVNFPRGVARHSREQPGGIERCCSGPGWSGQFPATANCYFGLIQGKRRLLVAGFLSDRVGINQGLAGDHLEEALRTDLKPDGEPDDRIELHIGLRPLYAPDVI